MASTRLKDRVALVTGAGSGFGAAIATRFAQEGCKVIMSDINEPGVASVSQKINEAGGNTIHIKMDVTNEAAWKDAVSKCLEFGGKIDILVNNAGTTYKNKPTLDVTAEEFDRVVNVNIKSIFLSVQTVVPEMKKAGGGSIINISSIGSVRPRPGLVWYNATKGAVTNATKGLAAEFGPDQIRVNAIAPLLSGTGLFESFVGVPDTPENREKFVANVPLGRLTDPMDIANAALYLASDEGRFVTGVNLEVDGGRAI
ncbi:oxidoreductase [Microthyrium microscopicum]|uniref:Oxidoreductase n=1 Tax=Microthyrium microscopicum TaxID=703497 RepID=A0A6A6UN22_9PEZI|nr:oxidoreductase [Microthyrium microscopicum]